jgi:DNA-binding protein HU-beta
MNKRQLVDKVGERVGSKKVAGEAVEAVLATIQDTVAGGETVDIAGFGKFESATRPPLKGVSSFNGKPWSVPATRVPKFKAGKGFKDVVRVKREAAA